MSGDNMCDGVLDAIQRLSQTVALAFGVVCNTAYGLLCYSVFPL
jgi:hypothetical protein